MNPDLLRSWPTPSRSPRYSAPHSPRSHSPPSMTGREVALAAGHGMSVPFHTAVGATSSHVPCQRLRRTQATSTPGTARQRARHPPGSRQPSVTRPVLTQIRRWTADARVIPEHDQVANVARVTMLSSAVPAAYSRWAWLKAISERTRKLNTTAATRKMIMKIHPSLLKFSGPGRRRAAGRSTVAPLRAARSAADPDMARPVLRN
jgi:hypothetical protein